MACRFSGCPARLYQTNNYSQGQASMHRVHKNHIEAVCKLYNIERNDSRVFYLCSAHFKEDAFVVGRDNRYLVRRDLPFIELLKAPSSTQEQKAPLPAYYVQASTSNFRAPNQDLESQIEEEEEAVQQRDEATRENQILDASLNFSMLENTSSNQAPSVALNSRRSQLSPTTSNSSKTSAYESASSPSLSNVFTGRDDADLLKQIEKLKAENQALVEANKALRLDLGVYRRLMQLESRKRPCDNELSTPMKNLYQKRQRTEDANEI